MKGIKLPEKRKENYLEDETTLKLIDWIKYIKYFMEIYQFVGLVVGNGSLNLVFWKIRSPHDLSWTLPVDLLEALLERPEFSATSDHPVAAG